MAELDTMLEANGKYAAGFAQGGLDMPPARAVAIVACMDARLHPAKPADGRRTMPSVRSSSPRVC